MVHHIDVVFDWTEDAQLKLIEKILGETEYEGGRKKRVFKPHLIPIPTPTKDIIREYYEGHRHGPTAGRKSYSYRDKPIKANTLGLKILDACVDDKGDIDDKASWDHLAVIFPNSRGKIAHAIKCQHQRRGKALKKDRHDPKDGTGAIDTQGNEIDIVRGDFYWKERYTRKILVLLYDKTPKVSAMSRYDRIWATNKNQLKKVRSNCRKCGEDMYFSSDGTEMECENTKCDNKIQHSKIVYTGKNYKNIDFIKEFQLVMG